MPEPDHELDHDLRAGGAEYGYPARTLERRGLADRAAAAAAGLHCRCALRSLHLYAAFAQDRPADVLTRRQGNVSGVCAEVLHGNPDDARDDGVFRCRFGKIRERGPCGLLHVSSL